MSRSATGLAALMWVAVGLAPVFSAGQTTGTRCEDERGCPAVMPLPYPDVWGVRLPPGRDRWSHASTLAVAKATGDIVIDFKFSDDREWPGLTKPYGHILYSFFEAKVLGEGRFPRLWPGLPELTAWYDFREAAVHPAPENPPFEYHSTASPPFQVMPGDLPFGLKGQFAEIRMFDKTEKSLFPVAYVRRNYSGHTFADKIFVEVFADPTRIAVPHDLIGDPDAARYERIHAVGVEFQFAFLKDGTILGITRDGMLAVRFDSDLDSPFLATDPHLHAISGELFRRWIEDARTEMQRLGRGPIEAHGRQWLSGIDDYLTERVLEHRNSRTSR